MINRVVVSIGPDYDTNELLYTLSTKDDIVQIVLFVRDAEEQLPINRTYFGALIAYNSGAIDIIDTGMGNMARTSSRQIMSNFMKSFLAHDIPKFFVDTVLPDTNKMMPEEAVEMIYNLPVLQLDSSTLEIYLKTFDKKWGEGEHCELEHYLP
jgi:hypothetical protein